MIDGITDGQIIAIESIHLDRLGRERDVIYLDWDDVTTILGHQHRGWPEDDEALVRWLLDHGAPAWVEDAEGWIDEEGWGLFGPPKE